LQTASPGSFDLTLSLALLSAVVIGGLGSLTGAVWGSIIVVYLGIVLRGFVDNLGLGAASAQKLHDNLPNAVYGLLLVVVMLVLPAGIQGSLRRLAAAPPVASLWRRGATRLPSTEPGSPAPASRTVPARPSAAPSPPPLPARPSAPPTAPPPGGQQ
jgi:branched-chain amino acid transport system permease protein